MVLVIPSKRPFLVVILALAILLLGFALRSVDLDARPMHNDEAVNALKFKTLWEQGAWRYDPNEHHGPTLACFTFALGQLSRAGDFAHWNENRLRTLTVLFGLGLILLLPLVGDGLGRSATVFAALFTAVSPAMVYYSRDYIHEMLLVFFGFLALAAGWRYFRSGKLCWAVLAGAAIGLMHGTKETFVLTLAAAGVALLLNAGWAKMHAASPVKHFRFCGRHLVAVIAVWIAVAVLFFSSFFTNAAGPLDSVRTYSPWLQRAGGDSAHIAPWTFYLERLAWFHSGKGPVWSEGLILLLGLVGLVGVFARKGPKDAHGGFVVFLAFYTIALTVIYSVLPYKTPWCLLSFWQGMILLAGLGAALLVESARGIWRWGAVLLLVAGTSHLGYQAWQSSVPRAADRGNPYAYAQTSPDILELVDKIEMLARAHPDGRRLLIKIVAPGDDYWPLPWYLRGFSQTGWWRELPEDPFAPVMVISTRLQSNLDVQSRCVQVGIYQLRPGIFFELYVETELWERLKAIR